MGINIQELKCKNCGGNLQLFLPYHRATCGHCGTNYFVEGKVEYSSQELIDSPINIQIIRDEKNEPIKLVDFKRYEDKNEGYGFSKSFGPNVSYTYDKSCIRGDRPCTFEVIDKLLYVAAMSFILKKCYRIEDIYLSDSFITDLTVDEESIEYDFGGLFNRKIKKECEILTKEKISTYSKIVNEYFENRDKEYNAYGIKVVDAAKKDPISITTKPVYYNDKLENCFYGIGKEKTSKLKFPIIDPTFFRCFFSDEYDKYESVKNMNVIESITSIFAEKINLASLNYIGSMEIYIECNKDDCRFMISKNSKASPIDYLSFHQFGMDNLPNELTRNAVHIAIIHGVIEKTRKNGQFMLDLQPDVFKFSSPNGSDSYAHGFEYEPSSWTFKEENHQSS